MGRPAFAIVSCLRAFASLLLVFASAAASAQASEWLITDLGPLEGGFVGPRPPTGTALAVGRTFAAGGGYASFAWWGRNVNDLGRYGPDATPVFWVNAAGEAVGQTPGDEDRAFYSAQGAVRDLGTLGGSGITVTGLGEGGHAIGYSQLAGDARTHAFVFDGTRLTGLGTLGGSYSVASAVNAAGMVVGSAYTAADAANHAYAWTNGAMRDLGTLGGHNSFASGVNDDGWIVGDSYIRDNAASHAFLWQGSAMLDLGTLGGTRSTAIAISDLGHVVGNAYTAGDAATHAFMWQGGRMVDLGTLGGANSYALGVNSLGQVIGISDVAGNAARRAFLWSDGRMFDLDSPIAGLTGFVATGINDAMQIIGYGMGAAGMRRGIVITPIPEPAAWTLMLAGLVVVAGRRGRDRTRARTPKTLRRPIGTADVVGTRVDGIGLDDAVARVVDWAREPRGRVVCACNVHAVVTARSDDGLATALDSADLVLPDGAPVAWLMRRVGLLEQRRVAGPDLMWRGLKAAEAAGVSVFLYGTNDETLDRLAARLAVAFPRLAIAGRHAPPYREIGVREEDEVVGRINASGAGIVWVSLGCPKQEVFMSLHRHRVRAVMVGVGAAFDFHAGTKRRAPEWMQSVGLEWLHRLACEPRRLLRRYAVTNAAFVVAAARQLASRHASMAWR